MSLIARFDGNMNVIAKQLREYRIKEVLYGKYMLKGRIRMFNVLLAGFKLYRNKWIREFITFSKETVKDL